METGVDKKKLRKVYMNPKKKLRALRKSLDITTTYMAGLIGISRRQYELKEKGKYPFNDYEMLIIAKYFNESINTLFLIINISCRDINVGQSMPNT